MICDDKLSMKQQVSKICQSAYLELRRISSVRHVITVAYRAGHSTETALLRVLNDLLTASNDGQVSLLTL